MGDRGTWLLFPSLYWFGSHCCERGTNQDGILQQARTPTNVLNLRRKSVANDCLCLRNDCLCLPWFYAGILSVSSHRSRARVVARRLNKKMAARYNQRHMPSWWHTAVMDGKRYMDNTVIVVSWRSTLGGCFSFLCTFLHLLKQHQQQQQQQKLMSRNTPPITLKTMIQKVLNNSAVELAQHAVSEQQAGVHVLFRMRHFSGFFWGQQSDGHESVLSVESQRPSPQNPSDRYLQGRQVKYNNNNA